MAMVQVLVILVSLAVYGSAFRAIPSTMQHARVIKLSSGNHEVPLSPQEMARSQQKRASVVFGSALLGLLGGQRVANAAKTKPGEYLKEPTKEFMEDVASTKAENAKLKKEREQWDALFVRFEESKTSSELEASLKALVAFLEPMDGIPSGFSKKELVKRCRARKNMDIGKRKPVPRPEWTKEVEIQYQRLTRAWTVKTTYNL